VPTSVTFATKPELARRMLQRTLDSSLPVAWVAGDSVYGNHRPLRTYLEERRQAYALGISCQERVEVNGTRKRADHFAQQIDTQAWHVLSCGEGSKGPRLYEWARLCTSDEVVPGWQQYLVIRRTLSSGAQPIEHAYFLVFARTGTTLQEMVQVLGQRWTIEQCLEMGKGEVGLDDYEVRTFHGWYRHITLSMLALAFLTALRASESEDVLKKSLSRRSRHRSQKQPLLLRPECLLVSQ
jgi:SRSO17 transposase